MPTSLDRAMQSRGAFMSFVGIIGAVAVWSIWGPQDMFPKEPDPTGDAENWSEDELTRWLHARGLFPSDKSTREELLARVKANMRAPR